MNIGNNKQNKKYMIKFDNLVNVVQIGANNGDDEFTDIIRENKNTIQKFIAVEPLDIHNESLLTLYSDINGFCIENKVVSLSSGESLSFFYNTANLPNYNISSLYESHIDKHMKHRSPKQRGNNIEIKVESISVSDLFKSHNLNQIDLLIIDTEGNDLNILKSINYGLYDIKHIVYEHVHINNNEAISHMKKNGYNTKVGVGVGNWSTLATKQ